MSASKLSDPEVQARAMQWLDSLTREQWQARIDAMELALVHGGTAVSKKVVSKTRPQATKTSRKILREVA
jgi:hypothetical protein